MTPRNDDTRRGMVGILLLPAALLFTAATLPAQSTLADTRWMPWIGCWQASADAPRQVAPVYRAPDAQSPRDPFAIQLPAPAPAQSIQPMVCVVPAEGKSAVDVMSLAEGKVVSHERVDASGERQPVDRDGCSGWQQAQWSADGRRVFLRAELACGPGLTRTTSGVLAMSAAGEWLDVQGMKAGGNAGVRVARYRDAGATNALPAEVSRVTAGRELAFQTARSASGTALRAPDIIEATKRVDTSVVQSWLAERAQHFALDPRTLVTLADAGVPGSVTDMMIAISYPDEFLVRQPAAGIAMGEFASERDSARIASAYLRDRCYGTLDPFAYSPFGWGRGLSPYYSSSAGCSRYGYSPYYAYSPYYSSYGYGYGPGGYYNTGYATGPVIITRGDEREHGKLVKGHGYTSGSTSSSSSETTRASSATSRGTTGGSESAGGSSSKGSTSTPASSSSSGSSDRTAHPRPPGH